MRNIEIGWEKSRELIVPCVRSENMFQKIATAFDTFISLGIVS